MTYPHRITVAIPDLLRDDFRHLEGAWGESVADLHAARPLTKQDALGAKYAAFSTVCTDNLLNKAGTGIVERPDYDVADENGNYKIDLAAAQRARDALVIWTKGLDPEPAPEASATTITAIVTPYSTSVQDVQEAIALMGLTQIPQAA